MQVRRKVEKSRFIAFFEWFVAPEGRTVGSLKRRARSHLARWEMKNCAPLWRKAHFEVKMYKTHHSRTTFGSCDVEKVHAAVARNHCWVRRGILHLVKSEQNVRVSWHVQKRWQARCISRGRRSTRDMFIRDVRRSVRALISWEELHFGGSDLQVC